MWKVQVSDMHGSFEEHTRTSYQAARRLFDALVHTVNYAILVLLNEQNDYVDMVQVN